MKGNKNYCVLKKQTNVDDVFSYMAGEYCNYKPVFCEFSILDDSTFPSYILLNAIEILRSVMVGLEKEDNLAVDLPDDFDGEVTPNLLGHPFLLWSKKIHTFFCFHFDTEKGDVSDEEFCDNYETLIHAYDFPTIIKEAKGIAERYKDKFTQENIDKLSSIYRRYGVGLRKISKEDE